MIIIASLKIHPTIKLKYVNIYRKMRISINKSLQSSPEKSILQHCLFLAFEYNGQQLFHYLENLLYKQLYCFEDQFVRFWKLTKVEIIHYFFDRRRLNRDKRMTRTLFGLCFCYVIFVGPIVIATLFDFGRTWNLICFVVYWMQAILI